jgi:hypothetical protein
LDPTAPVFSPAYNTSPKLFVVLLRALEAIRARPRFKDACKGCENRRERAELPIERFISQAQRSKLTGG